MSKVVWAIMRLHPYIVLVAYIFIIAEYRHYLDNNLKYIRPKLPAAPEDILGFGFWMPWLVITGWLALASFLNYQFGLQRKVGYWVVLVCVFCVLSIVDFYLYGVLERQVLGS